ncbi:MAG: response regulator [Planctomycetes bacterium]|nr:response regulator [Planctomycetota bacterium]
MSSRIIQVLHVEDDVFQRRLMAFHLSNIPDYAFAICGVESEDEAVAKFRKGGTDLVLLDYQLAEGDGLSCLRRLRQLDAVVPIVAVSGVAPPEIATELVRAGADDCLSKHELSSAALARSVCQALARADAFRRRTVTTGLDQLLPIQEQFDRICRTFAAQNGSEFMARLEEFENAARAANLTAGQVQRLFEAACEQVPAAGTLSAKRLLRPVLLEALLRLFGSMPAGQR